IKAEPDAIEEVHITPRGPILTPLIAGLPLALTLSAIWLEPRPLAGSFAAPQARSSADSRQHSAARPALPANMLYADPTGTLPPPPRPNRRGELPIQGGGGSSSTFPQGRGLGVGVRWRLHRRLPRTADSRAAGRTRFGLDTRGLRGTSTGCAVDPVARDARQR